MIHAGFPANSSYFSIWYPWHLHDKPWPYNPSWFNFHNNFCLNLFIVQFSTTFYCLPVRSKVILSPPVLWHPRCILSPLEWPDETSRKIVEGRRFSENVGKYSPNEAALRLQQRQYESRHTSKFSFDKLFSRCSRHIFTIDLSLLVSWVHHLGELCVDVRIILNWVFKRSDVEVWTELIRFRIGTFGDLLCTW